MTVEETDAREEAPDTEQGCDATELDQLELFDVPVLTSGAWSR